MTPDDEWALRLSKLDLEIENVSRQNEKLTVELGDIRE